jgi:tRNA-2-methylthio-N6-dimethylallyladenosine synthase
VKKRRLQEIIDLQTGISHELNQADIGKTFRVLIEGESKRSADDWKGRNSQNKMIIFAKSGEHQPGDYVKVRVTEATSATLLGHLVAA